MANYKYTTFSISVSQEGSVNADSTIEKKLNQKIKKMATDGWKLVSITPIARGKTHAHSDSGGDGCGYWGYGYGWGHSYTASLMVTMEQRK
jgi:hypothetical protein